MADKVGRHWFSVDLAPTERVIKRGEIFHRQDLPKPMNSFGELALTDARLIFCPKTWLPLAIDRFASFDRRLVARHEQVSELRLLVRSRAQPPVYLLAHGNPKWEVLRLVVNREVHFFATRWDTQAARAELEDWLLVIAEATGLAPSREELPAEKEPK